MRRAVRRVKHKAREHRMFLFVVATMLLLGLIVNYVNGFSTQQTVINTFQKNFEKQATAQLDVYNYGLTSTMNAAMSNTLDTVLKISQRPALSAAIAKNDLKTLDTTFKNLIATDNRFEGAGIFSNKGDLIYSTIHKNIGMNLKYRDFFKQTMATQKPYVSDVFKSLNGKNVLTYTSPILDASGNVQYIVASGISVDGLYDRLELQRSQQNGLSFALADHAGDLVMQTGGPPKEITNIKDKSPLIQSLAKGETKAVFSDINYLNQKVFAEGSVIKIGGNKFYLATYYQQSKYDHDLAVIKEDFHRALFISRMRSLGFFVIGASATFWIIKRHEEDS